MGTFNKRAALCGLGLVVALAGIPGCKMLRNPAVRGLTCGGGGAATGAIFYFACDAVTDKNKKGACIAGAAAAALADGFYCWWLLSQKIIDDYEATQKALNYDPSQGYRLEILDFSASPQIVHPGGEVKIRLKYALMSSYRFEEIKYEQKITVPGETKPRQSIQTRQPGTWGADEDYTIKIDPAWPDQKIEMTVEMKLPEHGQQARRTLCFTVSREDKPDRALLCTQQTEQNTPAGSFVITQKSKQGVPVHAAPNKKSKVLGQVRRGETYSILDSEGKKSKQWYKIQLEDGREGWLPASAGSRQE
jgi:hypothetical protein